LFLDKYQLGQDTPTTKMTDSGGFIKIPKPDEEERMRKAADESQKRREEARKRREAEESMKEAGESSQKRRAKKH